jgi:uncharacterized protein YndB with AHSA1/START domain
MPSIIHSVQIDAPAERIFPLVSTADGLSQWWAADVTEPGKGTIELGFFNRATIYTLQAARIAAPNDAEWLCTTGKEWAGTRIIFKLESAGGKTVLRFTHADWKAETDYFISCNTVWGGLMFRIRAAAEGKSQGPLFQVNRLAY